MGFSTKRCFPAAASVFTTASRTGVGVQTTATSQLAPAIISSMEPKTAGMCHCCAAASARDRSRSQTAATRTRSGWRAYPSKCIGETPPQPTTAISKVWHAAFIELSFQPRQRDPLHEGALGLQEEQDERGGDDGGGSH